MRSLDRWLERGNSLGSAEHDVDVAKVNYGESSNSFVLARIVMEKHYKRRTVSRGVFELKCWCPLLARTHTRSPDCRLERGNSLGGAEHDVDVAQVNYCESNDSFCGSNCHSETLSPEVSFLGTYLSSCISVLYSYAHVRSLDCWLERGNSSR